MMLWMIQSTGALVPEGGGGLGVWAVILIAVATFGLGTLLIKAQGDKIADAALNILKFKYEKKS
jgi:hypothetical protein